MRYSHTNRAVAAVGLSVLMGATTLSLPATARPTPEGRTVTLNTGTVIVVKLSDLLSSKDSGKGDPFSATVIRSDSDGDETALPIGTRVDGVVREARPKSGKTPGMLDLEFNRVTLPRGRSYAISGSPIGLDDKSVTHRDGRLVARNSKGINRMTYVGVGAGAGLLVNVLTHRKGTLLDTLVGAGLGYGVGSLVKGGGSTRDVELKRGARIGVRLDRRLTYSR